MQKLQNTFVTFCAKCAENFFKENDCKKEKLFFCIEPLQFSFLSNKKTSETHILPKILRIKERRKKKKLDVN